MNFLLDENVPYSIKKLLSDKGHVVNTIQDLGKQGASNGEVAQTALELGTILVTFDADFTIPSKDLAKKLRILFIKIHPRDPKLAYKLLDRHLEKCLKHLESPKVIKLTVDGIEIA